MFKKIFFPIIAISLIYNMNISVAGNHEVIHPIDGYSIGWKESRAIPYWMDQGSLGVLKNSQARSLVESMMNTWASVETARVGFSYQGELSEDVTIDNFLDYLSMTSCGGSERENIPKNVVPIVFDSDGQILEYLTGIGSSGEVGGLSTLRCFVGSSEDPRSIYQGMIIINGTFVDGKGSSNDNPDDLAMNIEAGVILHELGHLIGLDHSALNEDLYTKISGGSLSVDYSRYLPVMLPTVLRNSNSSTVLKPDDIAAISTLYPRDDYLASVGTITGNIKNDHDQEIRKVNVIARNVDDPLCEVFSTISGRRCVPLVDGTGRTNFNATDCPAPELLGDYAIEGVPSGVYTVEVEDLEAGWMRSGMFPSTLNADLPGSAEYFNNGDEASESPFLSSTVNVSANEVSSNIDIVLSGSVANNSSLDRMPMDELREGQGTRCLTDPVDYQAEVNEIDGGMIAVLGAVDAENAGAGCRLNNRSAIDLGISFIFLFAIMGLIAGSEKMYKKFFLCSFVLLMFIAPAFARASSIVPVDLDKMSRKAGKIFYGRCIDVQVGKDENGALATMITYEVIRGVKDADASTVSFKVFGNATSDGTGQSVTTVGMTSFYPGREDVLFLYKESPWGFTSPVGLWQGDFSVVRSNTGPRLAMAGDQKNNTALNMKSNSPTLDKIITPDELLDKVEKILKDE